MFSVRPQLRFFQLGKQSSRRFLANNATSAAEETEEWEHPDSENKEHHDLPSFIEYASRNNVDTSSTTYVGTHYEYTVKQSLDRLGMSLQQVGGKSDCGID